MKGRWLWIIALLPVAAGLILALVLQSGRWVNPLLSLQADMGTLLLLAGILLSSVALGAVALSTLARRRQLQAVVEEQDRAAEAHRRFVQRLDHELKNPLTAMRIGLANLSGALPEVERQAVLSSVGAQAERLARLAADLRKLAELEARPLERSTVDVGALLEEAVDLAQQQPAASERQVALSLPRAPWPLPPIVGDHDLLFLAVYNLIDNALKFTRPGDTVEVRAFEDGTMVVVEIADTGLGVPDEEQPHLFEELYRGQEARGIEGSGLGLTLVKAVVERHGGAVTIRSRAGQGSVFALRLPLG